MEPVGSRHRTHWGAARPDATPWRPMGHASPRQLMHPMLHATPRPPIPLLHQSVSPATRAFAAWHPLLLLVGIPWKLCNVGQPHVACRAGRRLADAPVAQVGAWPMHHRAKLTGRLRQLVVCVASSNDDCIPLNSLGGSVQLVSPPISLRSACAIDAHARRESACKATSRT